MANDSSTPSEEQGGPPTLDPVLKSLGIKSLWTTFTLLDTPQMIKEYRDLARTNYKPLTHIEGIWHPVYQFECLLINIEAGNYQGDSPWTLMTS